MRFYHINYTQLGIGILSSDGWHFGAASPVRSERPRGATLELSLTRPVQILGLQSLLEFNLAVSWAGSYLTRLSEN